MTSETKDTSVTSFNEIANMFTSTFSEVRKSIFSFPLPYLTGIRLSHYGNFFVFCVVGKTNLMGTFQLIV